MHSSRITFANQRGEQLAALLDQPVDDHPVGFAIFAHCFTCSKNLKAAYHVSRAMTERGFAVLRFDFTGLGESEGEFADTSFSSNVADLVAAARHLTDDHGEPALLIGHSLGGTAVLAAAADIPSVRAVVTIGAPSSPRHVLRVIGGARAEIERLGEAEVMVDGRPFRVGRQFLEDLDEHGLTDRIDRLGRALLVLHSPRDEIVGIDNATEIFVAARHPKSFVSLDPADHLLSRAEDSRYVGSLIAAWAERYLDTSSRSPEAAAEPGVVVARTAASGFRTELVANGHPLVADEPVRVGGSDAGPSPYDLVGAALAACTTMTIRMYVDRKGWPVDSVEARVSHAKVHCDDCGDTDRSSARIDRFVRRLAVEGALDEEQRRRLVEIADRCPVCRTLKFAARVETFLED